MFLIRERLQWHVGARYTSVCFAKDPSVKQTGRICSVFGRFSIIIAVCLLRSADTNTFEQLPPGRWKRWSKIVIWYSSITIVGNGSNDNRLQIHRMQKDLLSRLNECAPHALLEDLRSYICAMDRDGHTVGHLLHRTEHLWDSRLKSTLLDMLQNASLSPGTQRCILDFLWSKECDDALRVAEATISNGYTNDEEKDLVVECSAFLMTADQNSIGLRFGNYSKLMMTSVVRSWKRWHRRLERKKGRGHAECTQPCRSLHLGRKTLSD